MIRSSEISGQVLDWNGSVVEGALVFALATNLNGEVKVNATRTDMARSDDRGRYSFDGLVPGSYVIVIAARGEDTLNSTYFPSTQTLSRSIRIYVDPGQAFPSANLTLAASRTGTIRGNAPSGASISLRLKDGPSSTFLNSSSNEKGEFYFADVSEGTYELTARQKPGVWTSDGVDDKEAQAGFAEVMIVAGQDTHVDIPLRPLVHLSAKVSGDTSCLGSEVVEVSPLTATWSDKKPTYKVISGMFRSKGLPEGKYRILLPNLQNECAVQIKSPGPAEIDEDAISLDKDIEVTLHLLKGTGSVDGVVSSSVPISGGAFVAAIPDRKLDRVRLAQVRPDGKYSFSELLPGTYRLVFCSGGGIRRLFEDTKQTDAVRVTVGVSPITSIHLNLPSNQ